VAFAVPYVIGQFIVGLLDKGLMFGALGLLALGSGIIKPNISTLMGMTYDQQRPGQEQLRTQAFSWFYVSINIGSALSTIICPWLRNHFGKYDETTKTLGDPQTGYMVAFMFPAVLMAIAFAVFALGKKHYAVETAAHVTDPKTDEGVSKSKVVGQIFGLFFLVMFFWAIFDQHTSTWIYFAKDYLDLNVLGYIVPPDQIQALNPIFIVMFVPVVNYIFKVLARKGYKIRPTDKMIVGFLLTAFCMGIHAAAGYFAVNADGSITRVTILWQIFAFVVITFAEILISVTGLELAFVAAPKSMKSFITAIWLMFVGCANLFINTPVSQLYPSAKKTPFELFGYEIATLPRFDTAYGYFGMLTIAMLGVTAAFLVVAKRFNQSQVKA
jgi:POT family proton-dependent oligopeptide transporter